MPKKLFLKFHEITPFLHARSQMDGRCKCRLIAISGASGQIYNSLYLNFVKKLCWKGIVTINNIKITERWLCKSLSKKPAIMGSEVKSAMPLYLFFLLDYLPNVYQISCFYI